MNEERPSTESVVIASVSERLGIDQPIVAAALPLLERGTPVPYLARYCRVEVGGLVDLAQEHRVAHQVGHLDADGRLTGNGRQHADTLGGDHVSDVALQRGDLLDLHSQVSPDNLIGPDSKPADFELDTKLLAFALDVQVSLP